MFHVQQQIEPCILTTVCIFNHQSIKFICDKKEHNATQKKQSKYVDRTQRQYETTNSTLCTVNAANNQSIWEKRDNGRL